MDFNNYENLMEYPKRPEKPSDLKKTIEEVLKSGMSIEDLGVMHKNYEDALIRYNKDQEIYEEEGCRLHDLFRKDALEEAGLDFDEEIADKAFSYARQEGHSSGYSDIYYCLSEIADLIIFAYKKGKDSASV